MTYSLMNLSIYGKALQRQDRNFLFYDQFKRIIRLLINIRPRNAQKTFFYDKKY